MGREEGGAKLVEGEEGSGIGKDLLFTAYR